MSSKLTQPQQKPSNVAGRYRHWSLKETHSLIQIWTMPSIQSQLKSCSHVYLVWMKIARLFAAAHPEAPMRTREQCKERIDYLRKLYRHARAENIKAGRRVKSSPFYEEIDRVTHGDFSSPSISAMSSPGASTSTHASTSTRAPGHQQLTESEKKHQIKSSKRPRNWRADETLSLLKIWATPHIQSQIRARNKEVWSKITRIFKEMHPESSFSEVEQIRERMDYLKKQYMKARRERSRWSPFYKEIDRVLGNKMIRSSTMRRPPDMVQSAPVSTINTEEIWSLLQIWSYNEVQMDFGCTGDHHQYTVVWNKVAEKLQEKHRHTMLKTGEMCEKQLKQLMKAVTGAEDLRAAGHDASFLKQMDHVLRSVLVQHYFSETPNVNQVKCIHCSEYIRNDSQSSTLLCHFAVCTSAPFGIRQQFDFNGQTQSYPSPSPHSSPSVTEVSAHGSAENVSDYGEAISDASNDNSGNSMGIMIMNPRSESYPYVHAEEQSDSNMEMTTFHTVSDDMMISRSQENMDEMMHKHGISHYTGGDSSSEMETSQCTPTGLFMCSPGVFQTLDGHPHGVDTTSNTGRLSNQPMTVLNIKEEQVDETERQEFSLGHLTADQALARALCATGTRLNILQDKYWLEFMQSVCPGYRPPDAKWVKAFLLEQEYTRVSTRMREKIENCSSVAVISTGWANPSATVVKYVVATPQPVLIASHRKLSSEVDDVTTQLVDVVEKVGPKMVTVLMTDHIDGIEDVQKRVKDKFPHILMCICPSFTLRQLLRDVLTENDDLRDTLDKARQVTMEITDTCVFASIEKMLTPSDAAELHRLKEAFENGNLDVCIAVETLELLVHTMCSVQKVVPELQTGVPDNIVAVVNDEEFGNTLHALVEKLKVVITAIHKLEDPSSTLSDVRHIIANLREDVVSETLQVDKAKAVKALQDLILERIKSCISPVHFAAYILNPRYKDDSPESSETIQANAAITTIATRLGLDVGRVIASLAEFRAKQGLWKEPSIWDSAQYISPLTWWRGLCSSEAISTIACRLMDLPATVAVDELMPDFDNHLVQYADLTEEAVSRLAIVRGNLHLWSNNPDCSE